jgi:hypothetical protein
MTGNIAFNSVFTDCFLDCNFTDELVIEHELEEQNEIKEVYFFERNNVQIISKSKIINLNSFISKSINYLVYIDILSPPPEK